MCRPASSVPPRMPLTCTWVPKRTTCAGSVSWSQACSQVGSGVPVLGSVKVLALVSQIGSRSSA